MSKSVKTFDATIPSYSFHQGAYYLGVRTNRVGALTEGVRYFIKDCLPEALDLKDVKIG